MSYLSSPPSTPKGQLSAENTPCTLFSQLVSRIQQDSPSTELSRPSFTSTEDNNLRNSDDSIGADTPISLSSPYKPTDSMVPLSQRRKHNSSTVNKSPSLSSDSPQGVLSASPPLSQRRKRQKKVADSIEEDQEMTSSTLSPPSTPSSPPTPSTPPRTPLIASESTELSPRRRERSLSLDKYEVSEEDVSSPRTPPSPSAPYTPSLSSSSDPSSPSSPSPVATDLPLTPPMSDIEVKHSSPERDEMKDNSALFLSPDIVADSTSFATPDLHSEKTHSSERQEIATSKSNLKFILSDDNSNESAEEVFDMGSFFSPHIKKEDNREPSSDQFVKNIRKRSKSDADPIPSPPSPTHLTHRLRSSIKRPSSPSYDDSLYIAKSSKRSVLPPRSPSTRTRTLSFSPPPSYVSHQQDYYPHPSHPSHPSHPHHSHHPNHYSSLYPQISHPQLSNSYSINVHNSHHQQIDPYSYYYTPHPAASYSHPPSPPSSYTPPPPASIAPSSSIASSPPPASSSPASSAVSRNKVPCCTRCSARAAWKHDKKGKRWFCKICKLPFTPGVSPAHKAKEVVTIPPCPKCCSSEGWKQEKNKFFCSQCKSSFRPRVARSSTRVTPARTAKKGFHYDDEEDEDEQDRENNNENDDDFDSDFGKDVSPIAPNGEPNLSLRGGKNTSPLRNSTAVYAKPVPSNDYSKHYITSRRMANVDRQGADYNKSAYVTTTPREREEPYDDPEDALQMLLELKSKSR